MKLFWIGVFILISNIPIVSMLIYMNTNIYWLLFWDGFLIVPAVVMQIYAFIQQCVKMQKLADMAIKSFDSINEKISKIESKIDISKKEKEISQQIIKKIIQQMPESKATSDIKSNEIKKAIKKE